MVVGAPDSPSREERQSAVQLTSVPPYRISREDFLRFGESGAFGDRNFELLEGELYEITSQNRPHRSAIRLLTRALGSAFGENYSVNSDVEIPLGTSQPQPDVLVLRGTPEELAAQDEEEGPEDVALIVEVVNTRADTAAQKRYVYSAAGLPEYWILDVNSRKIIVHREPSSEGYRLVHVLDEWQSLTPLEPGAAIVAVGELLPPSRTD